MKRKSYLITGLIVMLAVATLFLSIPPAAAYAIPLPYCRFAGPVTLNGQNVPLGSIVSATIDGVAAGPWTTPVSLYGSDMKYVLDVPKNSGGANKNGGAELDIVRFSVTVNGSVMQDLTTATWVYLDSATTPEKFHAIVLGSSQGGTIPISITLPRWPDEVYPANPPASWLPLPPPGWIMGQPYSAMMTATGGTGALTWSGTGLPPGLTVNPATGVISGTPTAAGLYEIIVNVQDSSSPPNIGHMDPPLMIYMPGDANGNGTVTIADVTYIERVILELFPPTAGCDANLSGTVSIADVTKAERIILGLP